MSNPHQHDSYAGQFVLSQAPTYLPRGWQRRERGSWLLATHPSLPVADMYDTNDTWIGWVLGYPISEDSLAPARISLPSSAGAQPDILESALYRMGGRFVAVFLTEYIARVYLDCCGSLAVVHSAHAPIVASTPSLIDDRDHPLDEQLIRFLNRPESGLWFPFGLSPRTNVYRLLPNHYLDLTSWQAQRHWPKKPLATVDQSAETLARQILHVVRRQIAACASKYRLYMSLTAGHDSRMLLACAREQLGKIQFFTFARGRETADTYIARALARRFGLDHRVLQMEYANSDELAAWLDRTGDCVSGDIWKMHPTLHQLDPTRALLPGMAGEVARAFYWQDTDSAATRLSPRELVRRCHLPANEQILNRAEAWLVGIADFDCLTILDLMYIEQRLGCWGGPQQYGGDDRSVCQLFPLAHRAVFEAMLALPADYKREEQLARQICELAWPELLSLPFNEFSGWQRYPRRLARSVLRFGRETLAALRRRA